MSASVLCVDDDEESAAYLAQILCARGYTTSVATSAPDGLEMVRHGSYDIVITDHHMPGMTGTELCGELAVRHPEVLSIILTGMGNLTIAMEAIRAGAYDFLQKPVVNDVLEVAVQRAVEHQSVSRQVRRLRQSHQDQVPIEGFSGTSSAMRGLSILIRRVAPSDATVLITGESGTGKEVVARAVHRLSANGDAPFVAINCGAMPAALLESELFGHARGAFTDAKEARIGLFARAGKGTIFLDEIGEMPMEMQAKLLRVLQERMVRPVGGDTETPILARVIAATNRDLETEVEERRFREDLFHRLNVVAIAVPSLRERRSDILEIADSVLQRISARTGQAPRAITTSAKRKLIDYHWPGNVRELENSLERAVALTRTAEIDLDQLPPKIRDYVPASLQISTVDPFLMPELEVVLDNYVQSVLAANSGNRTLTARALGITRRSLYRRLH